jgi:hypothetical protein
MEETAVEMKPVEPVAEMIGGTAPKLGTTIAPEMRVETRVDPLPEASTT